MTTADGEVQDVSLVEQTYIAKLYTDTIHIDDKFGTKKSRNMTMVTCVPIRRIRCCCSISGPPRRQSRPPNSLSMVDNISTVVFVSS